MNVISEYLNKPWEKGNKQENTGLRNRRVTGKTEALPADYFFENACRDRVAMIKQDRRNEIREARNRRIRRDLLSLQAALTSEGTPAALVPGQRKQVHEQVKRTELTKNGTLRRYRWTRSSEANSDRGWIGYMQYVHGLIGCVLAVLALIHIPYPTPLTWLPYAGGAILAFITLKSDISIGVSRILAIGTAAVMFFLFAMFFLLVPKLQADWYTTQFGWAAVCRILGAFVMIPILSDYSCRLKAECREARAARRNAFFSVPSHIRPESR